MTYTKIVLRRCSRCLDGGTQHTIMDIDGEHICCTCIRKMNEAKPEDEPEEEPTNNKWKTSWMNI